MVLGFRAGAVEGEGESVTRIDEIKARLAAATPGPGDRSHPLRPGRSDLSREARGRGDDRMARRARTQRRGGVLRRLTIDDLTDDEREHYEERAAIREHDGRQSRADAERGALEDVLRWRLRASAAAQEKVT